MRKYFLTWGLLALAVTARAEPEFVKTLPADEFTAAGLQKLTPEELAKLEALVQRFKSGEVAVVRQQAAAQVTVSQQEAEKKVVAAESKAAAAEAKAKEAELNAKKAVPATAPTAAPATAATSTPAKKQPSWFSALITVKQASEKPEKAEPLESRLTGDFRGWSGKTVFSLENGSKWIQQNPSESYPYAPALHSPKVKIMPATMGGFWLRIEGVNMEVRVMPLELPTQK
jgi:hypothetical protein